MNVYRTEHPNPQWERESWESLNGAWEFDFDFGNSAIARKAYEQKLSKEINVPFCVESELSGIGYTDFIPAVCYRKTITIRKENLHKRIVLHIGASDYDTVVYINGVQVGRHEGGYLSFSFDISDFVREGENIIFIHVSDDTRNPKQPGGKQSDRFLSYGCFYTRTTGIWQSVWLEYTPKQYIKHIKMYPDIHNQTLTVIGETEGDGEVSATAVFGDEIQAESKVTTAGRHFFLLLKLKDLHLWDVGQGNLYDLSLTFGEDKVKTYFGMRNIAFSGMKFMLNGKSVFQRLVLDQGYYPDGIYTAKSEEDMIRDIKISQDAGFNGARLHEKVFEPRFLYHCDKMGYLVWGEYANWGSACDLSYAKEALLNEWIEEIRRDFNHPSIIGWCPYNETLGYTEKNMQDRTLETIYKITKALDSTRPCIDTSGFIHSEFTDIYDVHDYASDGETLKANMERYTQIGANFGRYDQIYRGEPIFLSEYGGIYWNEAEEEGWGYGAAPKTKEELIDRYKSLTDVALDAENVFGFCYTQLYDVEQEKNGLYTYEREPKFDLATLKKINTRKAKIEE